MKMIQIMILLIPICGIAALLLLLWDVFPGVVKLMAGAAVVVPVLLGVVRASVSRRNNELPEDNRRAPTAGQDERAEEPLFELPVPERRD